MRFVICFFILDFLLSYLISSLLLWGSRKWYLFQAFLDSQLSEWNSKWRKKHNTDSNSGYATPGVLPRGTLSKKKTPLCCSPMTPFAVQQQSRWGILDTHWEEGHQQVGRNRDLGQPDVVAAVMVADSVCEEHSRIRYGWRSYLCDLFFFQNLCVFRAQILEASAKWIWRRMMNCRFSNPSCAALSLRLSWRKQLFMEFHLTRMDEVSIR